MFEKASDAVKKCIHFLIKFWLFFREKLIQNREKKRVKRLSAQKSAKKTRLECISEQKVDSWWIFGLPMGPREAPKGRGRSGKTTPWRNLVPFCSFECITFAAGSILALFGHYFDTVLAHKKLPTSNACTLSVNGPAECAKRFESVAPLRDVLNASILTPA